MKYTLVAVLLLLAGPRVWAHHSFAAEFDTARPVTLTGTLSRIDWTNPHAALFVDVKEASGVATWAIELGSPTRLTRLGWRRDMLHIGDQVTVEGCMARFTPHLASALVLRLPTGQRLPAMDVAR